MTRLPLTLCLSLFFHQAFCCPFFPFQTKKIFLGPNSFQTKENFCADLDASAVLDELGASITRNLTEFCQSDSVGDAGNSLCALDGHRWIDSMEGLENKVAEFCNPGSPILRNEFRQRGQNDQEINIRVGISQEFPPDCGLDCQVQINPTRVQERYTVSSSTIYPNQKCGIF